MSENSGRVLAPSTVGRDGAADGLWLGNGEMRVRFVVELDRLGQASESVASPGGFGARRSDGFCARRRVELGMRRGAGFCTRLRRGDAFAGRRRAGPSGRGWSSFGLRRKGRSAVRRGCGIGVVPGPAFGAIRPEHPHASRVRRVWARYLFVCVRIRRRFGRGRPGRALLGRRRFAARRGLLALRARGVRRTPGSARRLLGLKLSKRGRKLISGRPRAFGNLDSIGREN